MATNLFNLTVGVLAGKKATLEPFESADHPVFTVGFEGDCGHVNLEYSPNEGICKSQLSLENGELSESELAELKEFSSNNNIEFHY